MSLVKGKVFSSFAPTPKKFLKNIYKIKDIYIYKKKIYIDFSYDIISMV